MTVNILSDAHSRESEPPISGQALVPTAILNQQQMSETCYFSLHLVGVGVVGAETYSETDSLALRAAIVAVVVLGRLQFLPGDPDLVQVFLNLFPSLLPLIDLTELLT